MKRTLTYLCCLTVAFTALASTPSVGTEYPKNGEKAQWIERTTAAADAGDPQAMWNIAEFLSKKDLNRRDYTTALKYYLRAAETWTDNAKKAQAYFNVARIYDKHCHAVHTELDYNTLFQIPIEYYEKALALSSGSLRDKCLIALGDRYSYSSPAKAALYYNKVSTDSPAEYCMSRKGLFENLGKIYKKDNPSVKRAMWELKDYTGDRFYKYYYLGALYEKDYEMDKAVEYYTKAANATMDRVKEAEALLCIAKIKYNKDSEDYDNITTAYELMDRCRSPKTYGWLGYVLRFSDIEGHEVEAAEFNKKALAMYVQQGADFYLERGLPDWDSDFSVAWDVTLHITHVIEGLYTYYSTFSLPSKETVYFDYAGRLGVGLPDGEEEE